MSDYDCMRPVIKTEEEYIESEPEEKITIFDIVNDISNHGKYIENYYEINKSLPKEFNSFMVIKAFSNFQDTILLANELNKKPDIPDEAKWRFLKETISKRKRYSKWFKSLDDEEPIVLLAKYYDCSVSEMRKNICVLSKEKIDEILKEVNPEKYDKQKKCRKK